MRKYLVLIAICLCNVVSYSQNVGIGTSNPQNKLHVGGGFRLDTLTGVNGAGLLRHDANGVVYGIKFSGNPSDVLRGDGSFGNYDINGSIGWLLNGNSGTNPATNFLGTTDDQPLLFRVNNIRHGYVSNNIFFGKNAGNSNTIGYGNIALGSGALFSTTIRNGLVAIGDSALLNNTGGDNIGIGQYALRSNVAGNGNTAVGNAALKNGNNSYNTAVGSKALETSTEGYNSAFGMEALQNNIGSGNSAFGFWALHDNNGSQNSAFGFSSLSINRGNRNSAFGSNALVANQTGSNNIAVGNTSLGSNTTGSFNSAVGSNALVLNTAGNENTAIGYKALEQNVTGSQNTATGVGSLLGNKSSFNSAFGVGALLNNNAPGADHNSAFGRSALKSNIGLGNTAVGSSALENNSSGTLNTAIGALSGAGLPNNVSNVTVIGYGTGWNTTISNQVNIGNFNISWIGGQVGWFHYSDRRIKNDIKDDVPGLSFISRLRPVTYHVDIHKQEEIANAGYNVNSEMNRSVQKDWKGKYDVEKIKMTGFFAQDVEEAAKAINYSFSGVHNPKNGGLLSLDYSAFVVPLVKAVQEQQKIIEDQNKKIDKQQQQIDLLIKEMQSLKKDLITQKN